MKKNTGCSICLLLTLFLCFLSTVNGAAGDFDTTFSLDGKTSDPIGVGGSDVVRGTAIQTDGKIVAAGPVHFGTNYSCGVARYNSDGTFDTLFDGDGKTVVQINSRFECVAVAIQSDGKIVIAGQVYGTNLDFAVARLNADGSLDNTFDGDGKMTTPVLSGDDSTFALAIQSDGKIVVAGQSYASNLDFAVIRLNTDGSLDTSFDADGKVTTAISSYEDLGRAVAIQTDGKIIVAGYSFTGTNYDFVLVRYNTNGSLDTSFDGDGKAITGVLSSTDQAYAVTIQADGKIIAAGYTYNGSNIDFALVRYNTNGSLDTSFDFDGRVITPVLTSTDQINAVSVQPDGKIVAAGQSRNGTYYDFALVRYNANGSLDTSFDTDGKLTTPILSTDDYANALVIQSDGKILATGNSKIGTTDDFALVRYNVNGSLDTSFDADGKLTSDVGSIYSTARAVAIQTDGKIVAAGYGSNGNNNDFAVVRYNTDGSFDTTFDGDGKTLTPVLSSTDQAYAVAIQADGKIVVVGQSYNGSNYDFAVIRYNSDGSLDTSFDGDGKATTGVLSSNDNAYAVAIQTDGKIVVAGQSYNGSNYDFAVVRYNTNGSLDTTFHADGKQTASFFIYEDLAWSVGIQSDGKIVLAGQTYNGSNADFALLRLNTDGNFDTTFDGDGRVTTPILSSNDQAYAMTIQPDGKIVAAGSTYNGSHFDYALARYNTNGSLDTSFDADGKLTTLIPVSSEEVNAIAVQADGKILAAGYTNPGIGADYNLIRYNADGSIDNTYGTAGRVKFDVRGASSDLLYGMALDSIGRAVIVGDASGLFTVVRLLGDTAPRSVNYSLSGRVQTNDKGIRNVIVYLTDASGITRATRTNSFGYYQFNEVIPGNCVVTIESKRFLFENPTRILNLSENIGDIYFRAIE